MFSNRRAVPSLLTAAGVLGASVAMTLAATPSASAATADIIRNGSFENPTLAAGAASFTAKIPGWVPTNACGRTCPGNAQVEVQNGFLGPARFGAQYVEIDSNRSTVLTQQVTATGAQRAYTLSITYAPRPGTGVSDNVIAVGVDIANPIVLRADGSNDDVPRWRTRSFTVTLGAKTAQLFIADNGVSNGDGMLIDRVSMVPSAA